MSENSCLVRALNFQTVDKTPVWIMRQAGRYLPEYRKIRSQVKDFLTLCKTPELACAVTLQPLHRFPLDAAIVFSDILMIPDALGLGLYFKEGEGPKFERPIKSLKDIEALPTIDPKIELRYVLDAIRLVYHELASKNIPIIGFAGSPWSVATYMVEGQGSKYFTLIKKMMYKEPKMVHLLLEKLTACTIAYLDAQIEAGAKVIMLFDTWGGILSKEDYLNFSLAYMNVIVQEMTKKRQKTEVPIIIFTKNGGKYLKEIALSGCSAVGLDWTADLKEARQILGNSVALQGNLDPAVLYSKPQVIQLYVEKLLKQFGFGTGHVFNLGHGIHPDVDPENVLILIEAVQKLSRQYHS